MNAIIVTGASAKEIAALVLAVQERRDLVYSIGPPGKISPEEKTNLADTIRSVLSDTSSAQSQSPQSEPKEHIPNQGEAPHPQEPLP